MRRLKETKETDEEHETTFYKLKILKPSIVHVNQLVLHGNEYYTRFGTISRVHTE